MKLNQKTLFYSMLLALFLVLFFLVYMVLFLPNLYVDHMMSNNKEVATELHFRFLEERSYEQLTPINVQNSISLVIPKDEDKVLLYSKLYTGELGFKDDVFKNLLNKVKDYFSDPNGPFPIDAKEIEELGEKLKKELPLDFSGQRTEVSYEDFYAEEDMKISRLGRNTMLVNMTTSGIEANYSMLFLLTTEDKNYVMTLIPVVNPKVGDILPVVLGSLPMVLVVLLLAVLIASALYSKFLVDPVMELVNHTRNLKDRSPIDYYPLQVKGKDELVELAASLNELQERISRQYSALEDQSKTQRVLLRAGSHQLKTPVAASLLLVEGMMGEVGKYKDVKTYLPMLREQLLSMQQIISAFLDMNRPLPLEARTVNLREVVEHSLTKTKTLFDEKGIEIQNETQPLQRNLPELFDWILSILVENALLHTSEKQSLKIWNEGDKLYLNNTGSQIAKEDLPHLFTPFVKGESSSGHGLGLYLASYYAKALGWELDIENTPSGVLVSLEFSKNTSPLHKGSTQR